MNKIIFNHLLSKKNRILIIIYTVILILVFLLPLPIGIEKYKILLDYDYYFYTYNEIVIELIKIINMLALLIVVIDHDNSYINTLITFKSRRKIITRKIFSYVYVDFIIILIYILFYSIILSLLKLNFLYDNKVIIELKFIFFDSLIILLLNLLLVREDSKVFGFITTSIYLLINFIDLNKFSLYVFYLLPVKGIEFLNYKNTTNYILIYIMLLIVINYYKYLNEDFI